MTSTQAHKPPGIPDALSKTIPIWCSVLNRVLFPSLPASHTLHVPPQAVSASEHSQMVALIPSFVESLRKLDLDISALRAHLRKPLRPMWVMQDSPLINHTLQATMWSICRGRYFS